MGPQSRYIRHIAVLSALAVSAGTIACDAVSDRGGEDARWEGASVAEVVARIGMVDGPSEYLFGDVRSVAADAGGRIYVADRIGSTVRVYDPEGRFLGQIGDEGQGPGEYEWPGDLTFGPDGRLYVRDLNRITVLESPDPNGIPDSVAETWRIPGLANYLSSRRSRVDHSGRYYYPARRGPSDFYLVFEGGEHVGDTVHVPRYRTLASTRRAVYMYPGSGDGRVFDGLAHAPFEPVASWDITSSGNVVGGDGARQRVLETNAAADSVDAVAVDVRGGRRPVPTKEREDSARAFQARVDSLPVPVSELQNISEAVRAGQLPDSLPAWRSVHVADDGSIWIERWPLEGEHDKRFFDVFSELGAYKAPVVIPVPLMRDPPPFFTDGAVYGVVADSATQVHQIVKLVLDLDR